jgi:adenylyltransferase/sulfurtransferase
MSSVEQSNFTQAERIRYSRQMLMPEVGAEGQARLKDARVLCVGAGGLGSPLLMYLAAAGVGTIGIVDFDRVESSNLHRQVLYGTSDEGRPKLEAAAERLEDLNPELHLELFEGALTSGNAEAIIESFDVVADGTDNFAARYAVNEACVRLGKPNVHGAIFRFDGQVTVFDARRGPCYRCIFPEPPPPGTVPSCAEAGVLGVLPGVVGSLQGIEVLKLLLGKGEPLIGRLLIFDALAMSFDELRYPKDPQCPSCGPVAFRKAVAVPDAYCEIPHLSSETEISAKELAEAMESTSEPLVLDVREQVERDICHIPGDMFIPMGDVGSRYGELPPEAEIVVYCRSGVRSADVAEFLRERGFTNVRNLAGGILAWAKDVDPSMPTY